MANINKIQLPNGTQYDIEDAVARANIVNTLSALSDTAITSPANGQVLTYDSTTSKWINSTASGGTGVTYQLSMTNNVITLTGSDSSTSSVTLPVYNGSVSVVTGGGS